MESTHNTNLTLITANLKHVINKVLNMTYQSQSSKLWNYLSDAHAPNMQFVVNIFITVKKSQDVLDNTGTQLNWSAHNRSFLWRQSQSSHFNGLHATLFQVQWSHFIEFCISLLLAMFWLVDWFGNYMPGYKI